MRRAPELPLLLAAALLALAAAPGLARAATDAADGTSALLPPLLFVRGELVPRSTTPAAARLLVLHRLLDRALVSGLHARARRAGCYGLVGGCGGAPTVSEQGDRTGSASCGVRCGCCASGRAALMGSGSSFPVDSFSFLFFSLSASLLLHGEITSASVAAKASRSGGALLPRITFRSLRLRERASERADCYSRAHRIAKFFVIDPAISNIRRRLAQGGRNCNTA